MADDITVGDVEAVIAKLEAWGNGLPDKERAVLRTLLANLGDDEVAGFAMPGAPGAPGLPGAGGLPFSFQPGAQSLVHQAGLGMNSDGVFIQITPTRPGQTRSM